MADILIILALIVLNGIFALAELAIVSARRLRLERMALEGNAGADTAIRLADDPSRFLSTVQVGMTLIGIFNGAFGEASLVARLTPTLATLGLPDDYARPAPGRLAFARADDAADRPRIPRPRPAARREPGAHRRFALQPLPGVPWRPQPGAGRGARAQPVRPGDPPPVAAVDRHRTGARPAAVRAGIGQRDRPARAAQAAPRRAGDDRPP